MKNILLILVMLLMEGCFPSRSITSVNRFYSLEEINSQLFDIQSSYPDIVKVEQIGETSFYQLPIWAVKVSDNVSMREKEPRILFVGVHHAREPIGASICLEAIKSLCNNYTKSDRFTRWINSTEIWFVPVVNSDGYKYVWDNNLSFPWWRKNLRDNDGDGIFNPLHDGVDLNRNYDFNWQKGESRPSSWFFRGDSAFSEKEIQAIKFLAERERFTFGVSYHSYGEVILFPKMYKNSLVVEIAAEMASKIVKISGHGSYRILPLNSYVGQSSNWMCGKMGVIDYIVEAGDKFFPDKNDIPIIVEQNLQGVYYLLDKAISVNIKRERL